MNTIDNTRTRFKDTDKSQEELLCAHVTGILKMIKDRDAPDQFPITLTILSEDKYQVAVNGMVPKTYTIL